MDLIRKSEGCAHPAWFALLSGVSGFQWKRGSGPLLFAENRFALFLQSTPAVATGSWEGCDAVSHRLEFEPGVYRGLLISTAG